jgi:hypothetical protein
VTCGLERTGAFGSYSDAVGTARGLASYAWCLNCALSLDERSVGTSLAR